MAAWQRDLELRAVPCEDAFARQRMGPPLRANVLGQCALQWLADHAAEHLQPERPKVLLDYSYSAMAYPLADYSKWLQLLSFLPQDTLEMPERKGAGRHQILLGPPILHRLRSLFATSVFVDVQLALRFDDLAAYATLIDPLELIAHIVAMGRTTYLVLSCTPFSDMTDDDAVRRALGLHTNASAYLGIRLLEATVDVLAALRYGTCVKPLLKVTVRRMERVGRAKWCYYPSPHFGRFRLLYNHHTLTVQDLSTTQPVPPLDSRRPWVPLSEVLGWGVPRDTRELWFALLMTLPPCRPPAAHNIALLAGGTLGCRPAPFALDGIEDTPTGKHYLMYLQLMTCTGHGKHWRLRYGVDNVSELAHYTTAGHNELKFHGGTLLRAARSRGDWQPPTAAEQREVAFVDDGRKSVCHKECKQCYRDYTSPGSAISLCRTCVVCVTARKQHHSLAQTFVGCHDMDGVAENGVRPADAARCYATQRTSLTRPSAQ